MKQYGVYVKFSSNVEYNSLGGYYSNEDNVIARTPTKNADNLYELKNTVLELLEDHVTTFHFRNYMINKLL